MVMNNINKNVQTLGVKGEFFRIEKKKEQNVRSSKIAKLQAALGLSRTQV